MEDQVSTGNEKTGSDAQYVFRLRKYPIPKGRCSE